MPAVIKQVKLVAALVAIGVSVLACDNQTPRSSARSVTYHALNKTHQELMNVEIRGEGYPVPGTFGVLVPGGWKRMSLPTRNLAQQFQVSWKVKGETRMMDLALPAGFDPEHSTILSIEFREDGEVIATARPNTDGLENYLKSPTSAPMGAPASDARGS